MAVLLAISVSACSPVAPSPASTPSPSTGVAIPPEGVPAWVQCKLDRGFRPVEVIPPQIEGYPPEYRTETDLSTKEAVAVIEECLEKYPSPEKTDPEIRVIYDRWVKERECLVGLGYHPVEPPTFEKFLADWRSTGPWMPIDGIDTEAWTDADYRAAKEACTLEFFSRD